MQQTFPSLGLNDADVVSTWAGVRPVIASGQGLAPSKEAREHLIVKEAGLITVTGGKLTTFRGSAIAALKLAGLSPQGDAPLLAATTVKGLPARWLARHGDEAAALQAAAQAGELDEITHTGCCWAELRWACRAEAIVHLDDLLLRRTRLGLLLRDGAAALLPRLKSIAQEELGWSEAQWMEEQTRYRELITRCYGHPR